MDSETTPNLQPAPSFPAILLPAKTGRRCSACDHPQAAEIDAALTAGNANASAIAKTFGITNSSLHRHKHGCIPVRLTSMQVEAVVQARVEADRQVVKHLIASSEHRMGVLQRLEEKLSAAAEREEFQKPIELNRVSQAVVRLHRQAALETGEHLAQQGKSAYGAAQISDTPIVLVVSAAAAMPTAFQQQKAPEARHVIRDGHTRKTLTAPDDTPSAGFGVPLSMVDIEQEPEYVEGEDTREQSLSGVTREPGSRVPAPPSASRD